MGRGSFNGVWNSGKGNIFKFDIRVMIHTLGTRCYEIGWMMEVFMCKIAIGGVRKGGRQRTDAMKSWLELVTGHDDVITRHDVWIGKAEECGWGWGCWVVGVEVGGMWLLIRKSF